MVINQTDFGCYQTGWARSVIEGTMFFAWIVIGFVVSPESPLYEPAIQGLSSIPFAILGGFIVSGLRKEMFYTLGLLIIYACLALFLWAFFMAAICA